MKRCIKDRFCRLVKAKPETTYDNFARDFSERFVAEYRPLPVVGLLMHSPFNA